MTPPHKVDPHWRLNASCASCNERNRINASRLFTSMVRGLHGRIQKQIGYFCDKCRQFAPVHAASLQRGHADQVPTEQAWLETKAWLVAQPFIPVSGKIVWATGAEGFKQLTDALEAAAKRGAIVALQTSDNGDTPVALERNRLQRHNALGILDKLDITTLGMAYVDAQGRFCTKAFHHKLGAATHLS